MNISFADVEAMSHFGVVRDWVIKLKNGQEIQLGADVIKQIVDCENKEAGYVKLAEDQSLPDIDALYPPTLDKYDDLRESERIAFKAGQDNERAKLNGIYKDAGDLRELATRIKEYLNQEL